MLGICLRILAILGILLLILAALGIGLLLLILFFPLTYRISGVKDKDSFGLTVKAGWLFGLARAVCRYPDPGRVRVKVLCFTILDQDLNDKGDDKEAQPESAGRKKGRKAGKKAGKKKKDSAEEKKAEGAAGGRAGEKADDRTEGAAEGKSERSFRKEAGKLGNAEKQSNAGAPDASSGSGEENGLFSKISSKIEKIKNTFRTVYDKIREIWENISYYIDLVQEEEIRLLLSDSLRSLGKILKSIRPRRIRGDIRFGTGSPDTTGYVYGGYCMLSPIWTRELGVTPDFEEKVLEGKFDISGRITLWVLLVNGLKMYKLIRRLKAAKKQSA